MRHDPAIILMVDDRKENLLALEAVLQSPSYRLIGKSSGEDALRYLLEADLCHLALILIDVQMPGMDGYETAALMRQRKELRNVPIIFITATYKSKTNVKQGYLNGSIDYIFKPYDPEALRWKVENFVTLHQYKQELEQANRKLLDAEQKLLRQQKKLERTVEERTKQLQEANLALEQSTRYFRKIFVTNPNLMAIRKLDDGSYIEINTMWEQTTGFSLEAMRELGDRALLIDLSDIPVQRNTKIQFRTNTGELRHGLLSREILDMNDEAIELIVITDISDQVAMEKHLSQTDRFYLIGEMAAGIAHEIRNPLTTIQGFLQMWKKSRKPLPMEHIDLMLSELFRANTIINEYLSLAGNKESQFKELEIGDIIDCLSPLIEAVAMMEEKQLIVQNEAAKIRICANEKELRQMILNLAKNGLEAMKPGGVLQINTYADGENVVIDVIDEGSGIPDELLSKVGTPFFTTKESGTGLGLALCYSIVERHRGKIRVTSSPEGTTFSVRLPKM